MLFQKSARDTEFSYIKNQAEPLRFPERTEHRDEFLVIDKRLVKLIIL